MNQLRTAQITAAIFMAFMLLTGKLSLAGLIILGILIALVYLARRFPVFGTIGGGLFLLGSPFTAWLLYNPKFFHTEGSPAGLVLMLFFVIAILLMMGLGLSMLKVALFPDPELAPEERAKLAFEMMRNLSKSLRKQR